MPVFGPPPLAIVFASIDPVKTEEDRLAMDEETNASDGKLKSWLMEHMDLSLLP